MPIKKVKGKSAARKAPANRQPQGSVRPRILELLGAGPLTRGELLKRGGFSQASLYLHLKALRKDGIVVPDADNRKLKLAAGAPSIEEVAVAEVIETPRAARPTQPSSALVPAGTARALHEALDAVLSRLSPIDRPAEKLLVLEQLARTTPDPVSEVLQLLIDDVRRLSAA
jgi:DNA-binding transcriptional ArsR family regulator